VQALIDHQRQQRRAVSVDPPRQCAEQPDLKGPQMDTAMIDDVDIGALENAPQLGRPEGILMAIVGPQSDR
jgi:hypothetical protein